MLSKENILEVGITSENEERILEYVMGKLKNTSEKLLLVTPNPEIIVYANSHPEFREILNQAQISLPDGIGIVLASLFLGKKIKHRVTGIEMLEKLCKRSVREGVSIGFLGGRARVAEKTAKCLQKRYPGLRVSFIGEEWEKGVWIPGEYQARIEAYESLNKEFGIMNNEQENKSDKPIHNSSFDIPDSKHIDILFVAFGFPKQEEWIARNLASLPFRVGMGVGGAFDMFSKNISRAPILFRRLGLEWFYRLLRQPWRLRRQFALLKFIALVFSPKLK